MTNLTPDQLPNSNAQFIAYGPPERVADPFGGDDPVTIRPQVLVRYYRGVKIKEISTPNEDTVHVAIDPESVGLEKAFGGYLNSNDPVVPYLREQFEAGKAVDIGLEYVRNKKAKDSKELISPVVPIYALRGASAPDGSGDKLAMMQGAGNHTSTKVALINGRRSGVSQSDPTEWQVLTSNRKGDLPPEGWKSLTDPEDWTKVGVIVPKGDTVPASGQNNQQAAPQQQAPALALDANTLANIVQTQVRMALKEYGDYLRNEEAATRGNPTGKQTNGNAEPKPWVVRVNKDHLNLGSYLVTGEGYVLRWAYRYLQERGDETLLADQDLHWAAADELAEASQRITDRVQAAAYNGEVRADRTHASFKEASAWVRFQIENVHPFETSNDFDYDAWFNAVGAAATQCIKKGAAKGEAYLGERYPQNGQQQTKPQQEPAKGEGEPEDRGPVVDAFLQMLTRSWTDRDALRALAGEAKEKDLLGQSVWGKPAEGQFSAEQFDGADEYTIGDLTKRQYDMLSQQQESNAPQETAEDTAPAAQQPESSTGTTTEQQPEAGQGEPAPEYTVQHVARALANATAEAEVRELYNLARDRNFLTTEIAVAKGEGAFGVAPVAPNTEGAEQMTLGAVFDAIRKSIDAGTQPAQAPNGHDTSASTSDEAPHAEQPQQQASEPEAGATEQPASAEEAGQPDANGGQAQNIAERALNATTDDEIKALYAEAQEAGIEGAEVTVKGRSGPLGGFLKNRAKRVARSNA